MKITIKQLRKIIKEELEVQQNIFNIAWGRKGIVEREEENIEEFL